MPSPFAEPRSAPKRESSASLRAQICAWLVASPKSPTVGAAGSQAPAPTLPPPPRGWKALVEDFCRNTEDVVDPHKVGDRTTSSVKNQNIRKPGQVNEAGPIVNRNWRLNVNQHRSIVKPIMKFERIKGWDEVVADMKFQATKRMMQELYQRAKTTGGGGRCKNWIRVIFQTWQQVISLQEVVGGG